MALNKRKNQEKIVPKVLFYTHTPKVFRATLIGHLFEIAKVFPTILLSEELDVETKEALQNKKLFPKLEKIIPVHQLTGEKINLLAKNRYLCKLAKKVIYQYEPGVVIAASDMHSLFELYLMRFAKNINALKITIQPSNTGDIARAAKWVDLTNVYLRFPAFLPIWLRFFIVKCRKYLGHFLYFWILPLTVLEKPFFGKSSYILRKGNSGMRDSDYQIVFSKRDYNSYLRDGVPSKKLLILSHPLTRKTREFFEKVYFNKFKKYKEKRKVMSLMLPGDVKFGFRRADYSPITAKEREEEWIRVVDLIKDIMPSWKIYIKPHPLIQNIKELTQAFESLSNQVKVVKPSEPADKYIEIADIIVGLPLGASTVLFTASLQCPKKPILSLDFYRETVGDIYKDFEGIEYINSKEKFIDVLKLIRDKKYHKKNKKESGGFSDAVEVLKYSLRKKNETH